MEFDALVVGASVCGSLAARELAEKGHRVAVLEEHDVTGKLGKCTAIVSKKGLDSLNVYYGPCKLNEVRGARIFSGSEELTVQTPETQAIVLNRFAFDDACVASAEKAGASILTGKRVESVKKGVKASVQCADKFEYSGKVLIGADGVGSAIARQAGFPEISLKDCVVAFEAEYDCVEVEKDYAYVFLEKEFKGFFGWVVPCSDTVARVGFATRDFKAFNKAKEKLSSISCVANVENGKKCREFSHLIPLKVRTKTQDDNILLAGDAAGQVKATTGGGIVYGGNCAIIAGREASNFLDGEKLEYERKWREKYDYYLKAHALARRTLDSLSGPAFLKTARTLGAKFFLERFGDMDYFLKKQGV